MTELLGGVFTTLLPKITQLKNKDCLPPLKFMHDCLKDFDGNERSQTDFLLSDPLTKKDVTN